MKIHGQPQDTSGFVLPGKYSSELINNFLELTPNVLAKQLGPYLTKEELNGFIFRREVILTDAAATRKDIIFPYNDRLSQNQMSRC